MLRNYLKTALRSIWKNKLFSIINVFGLALGITAFLFILYYVADESSYDTFHKNRDRVYRLAGIYDMGGEKRSAVTNYELGKLAEEEIEGIEKMVRLDFGVNKNVEIGKHRSFNNKICYADEAFFELFTFEIADGEKVKPLYHPDAVVLTKSAAVKYFGRENPIGKVLKVNNDLVKVTAIMEDIPSNSHFHFDVLVSMRTAERGYPDFLKEIKTGAITHYTYILAEDGFRPEKIEAQFRDMIKKHLSAEYADKTKYFLQPLSKIHLNSNLDREIEPNGDIAYVTLFSIVAFIILLIACINYTNLSTASAIVRTKEVGVRKVIGASRKQLVFQFLSESVLMVFLALIIALFFSRWSIPLFNDLSGKHLTFNTLLDTQILAAVLLVVFLLGLLAGSYPALFLSALTTFKIFRSATRQSGAALFRRSLIVLQFASSIVLVVSTLVVSKQLGFIRNKEIGINPEQVISIPMNVNSNSASYDAVKAELLQNSHVISITASSNNLTSGSTNWSQYMLEDNGQKEDLNIQTMEVDYGFFETLQAEFVAGRSFSKQFNTDPSEAYIINEAAAKLLNVENAVGKPLSGNTFIEGQFTRKKGRIIGVVKDFHFASMHQEISPVVFNVVASYSYWPYNLWIRVKSDNLPTTVDFIQKTWKKYAPEQPLEYSFLNEDVNALYKAEQRFFAVFNVFSKLAIIISCLGAFGLVAFTTYQRTKEIGIRKVLGASVFNLTLLLSKDFLILVVLANLVAWPVAWLVLNNWLEGFAYRIAIDYKLFAVAGLIALLVALVTVCLQTIKAAIGNPVKALKCE